ncbi:MAG: hypothetical protein COA84_15005 [Robiginitomaculum sp.]|nr:MAG: hypothetical protein COA84_15005 [Robiginitomaculum sp.]
MNDLEIRSRILKIEGHTIEHIHGDAIYITDKNLSDITGDDEYIDYNPLTDDALCFQLMVKYEVKREWEPYDFIGWNYHCEGNKNPERITERTYFGNGTETPDISPNKAILLAIIAAHND